MIAVVALGSNLPSRYGDREENLREALKRLGDTAHVAAVSSFYDTEPVGYQEQPRFLNAAALIDTELGPTEFLRALLAIERAMGRDRSSTVAKGPRVIDLDLLVYGDVTMQSEELTLPHPAMHERRFVLEPVVEITPERMHPLLGKTMRELLEELP